MRIEAVIICSNYSDFLKHTLAENIQQLDDVLVVTTPEDRETQKLCSKYSIQCIPTTVFTEYGDAFNKGRAINLGLSNLRKSDWLLHIDADIVLPKDFRRLIEKSLLDPKNIYGADRMNVYGYESWMKLKPLLDHHYDSRWFIDPGFCHQKKETEGIDIRMGARVIHEEHGYVPIGYFQLWHKTAGKKYNHKLGEAAGSDVLFPAQWPRANRVLLPDVTVYHLDSETTHGIGTNWKGRKSRLFGPAELTKHHHPYCPHHHHHKHHHHKHHHCPVCHG